MPKSRYADTPIVSGSYQSFTLPRRAAGYAQLDLLEGVKTTDYLFKQGDRLDHLAARYLGEDQYWWVIALVNGINYPFASGGLVPGRILKVPIDVNDVLAKILR
jgi:hypothetical protein